MSSILSASVRTPYGKDINVSSVEGRDDSFIITVTHDNIIRDIFARVYEYRGQWYIWYEKLCYRSSVKNFSTALRILEREILSCVA